MDRRTLSGIFALLLVSTALLVAEASPTGRTVLQTQTATAISTPTVLAVSSSPGGSATASRTVIHPAPQPAPAPATAWNYGICPLVVLDADFYGNDIANAVEPDVATCCNECLKSLNAWRARNPDGVPGKTDDACIGWTYSADRMCYLKNSVQNSSGGLTIVPIPGSFTGTFAGNITAIQPSYDQIVKQYLIPVRVRAAASAVANAGSGESSSVNASCTEPHCQQIVTLLNQTATALIASG